MRPRVLGIFALVFAVFLNFAIIPTTSYAIPAKDMSPTEQAKSWLYFNALSTCVDKAGVTGSAWSNTMSTDGISSGKWFISGRVNPSIGFSLGGMGVSVDGFPQSDSSEKVECGGSNIKWISDAFRLWGYSNNLDAWCDLTGNLKRKDGTICSGSSSSEGWDAAEATQALRNNFERVIRQKIYAGAAPSRNEAAAYAHAQAAFYGGCLRNAAPSPYTGSETGDTVYTNVAVVNVNDGTIERVTYAGAKKKTDTIGYSISPGQNNISDTCANLVNQMSQYAARYAAAVQLRIEDGQEGDTGGSGAACNSDGECTSEAATSCSVEGVGWIICPITTFMAGVSDGAFSVISEFLTVNTSLYNNTDSSSGTYAAWSAFRNIANVAFAILFIFIIYSQLTGMGVSNYGIKKTLPRLIIAAILVNLSFFVCQLAVDVTQILGGAINGFLQSIPVSGSGGTVSTWQEILGPVLAGTVIVGGLAAGAAILALSISLPLLLAFLVAVVMTIIILVGRQAAIVILIILSPIAFVAYLLPNTEKWFKRWYTMFGALLMVFPIIALLYGGGALASKIIANAGNAGGEGMTGFTLGLTAIAVSAIPLIMTPSLLRNAMKSTGSIGGKLSGWAGKANSRMKSTANNSRLGEARQGMKNKFALKRAERRVNGKGAFSRIGQKIDNSAIGSTLGLDKGAARAVNTVLREDDQEVEAAVATIKFQTNSVDRIPRAKEMLKEAIKAGDETQARAAQKVLLGSGNPGIAAVQEVYAAETKLDSAGRAIPGKDDGDMKTVLGSKGAETTMSFLRSDLNSAGLKGKNNALTTFAYSGTPDSFNDALRSPTTYTKLNPVELAGQSIGNLETNSGHITADMAQSVLNNDDASSLLDAQKRAFFQSRAGGATVNTGAGKGAGAAATAPAGTVNQPSATGQQAGAGPGAQNVPPTQGTGPAGPATQRAQQAAQQAAQGTSGTSPFVVSGTGTATAPAGHAIPSNNSGSLVIPHNNSSSSSGTPAPTVTPTPAPATPVSTSTPPPVTPAPTSAPVAPASNPIPHNQFGSTPEEPAPTAPSTPDFSTTPPPIAPPSSTTPPPPSRRRRRRP